MAGDIADRAAKENPRAEADRAVLGIVEQWAERAGGGVGRVGQVGQQHAHIGVERLRRRIDRCRVILVGVARVEQNRLVDLGQGDVAFPFTQRIAVGAAADRFQVDRAAFQQFLDDMRAAVGLARFAVFGFLGCAEIGVDRCQAGIGRHSVQPDFFHPDRRVAVAKIQKHAGRAHRAEGGGRDHIDGLGDFFRALLGHHRDDFLGGDDYRLTGPDLGVDFFVGLTNRHYQ